MARRPALRELSHLVMLCTSKDVVTVDGKLRLMREDVAQLWAKVENKQASMFGANNMSLSFVDPGSELSKQGRHTHLITTRMKRDLDITSAAWVYEKRMQSGDRWFKVLGIKELNEEGGYMVLSCRVMERGEVEPPAPSQHEEDTAAVVKRHNSGVRL